MPFKLFVRNRPFSAACYSREQRGIFLKKNAHPARPSKRHAHGRTDLLVRLFTVSEIRASMLAGAKASSSNPTVYCTNVVMLCAGSATVKLLPDTLTAVNGFNPPAAVV
jgi:hypothetical protein